MSDPHELLREHFGHEQFLPGQLDAVERLLAGRSVLAVFPTGGGKSLCFQLPALALDGLTLVVSPLIALMKDQVDALLRRNIAAARLDSTLDKAQVFDLYDRLASDRLAILYVAPERLSNERFLARLRGRKIALLAIDEAHCISEWGHNFRPDYLKLAQLARDLRVERVLALTATATPPVATDIRAAFAIEPDDHVQTGFHRPNLHIRVLPTTEDARPDLLVERLRATPPGPTIVYVTLQRTAAEVAALLAENGWRARAYHAGLADDERHAVQDLFMTGSCEVVVATIAFGMGIDKADIRRIFHYNLPKTLENYVQEIGRAGRDGKPAVCELLAVPSDRIVLSNFTYGDTPDASAVGALLDELVSPAEDELDVAHYDLSTRHDMRQLVVATALTYLELDGILAATGPFYSGYKVKPTRPISDICADFDDRRSQFLDRLLRCGKQGRVWITLDLGEAEVHTRSDRKRIIAALDHLEGRGDLELQVTGLRHGYRRVQRPDLHELTTDLVARFLRREQQDLGRLETVLRFVREPGCRTRRLLDYFGEDLGHDCGHCSSCEGVDATPLAEAEPAAPSDRERQLVEELVAEGHRALKGPRQLTRFLCGLTSPAASRARLGRHRSFGALSRVPFQSVLELVTDVTK